MTIEYYTDDKESCDGVPGEIVVEVNRQVEIGINNKEHQEDEEKSVDEPPELMSHRHEVWDCNESTVHSMPELVRCHYDDEEWESNESTIQSMDERVQSEDIPRDVTVMMIDKNNKEKMSLRMW